MQHREMFALLIHIYYPDSWEKIFREQLRNLQSFTPLIMINLCATNLANTDTIVNIKKDFPEAYIITTPNKGKDIGGKLALIDLFLKTNQSVEYMVILHDKVSPHSITGDKWRAKLFSIIDPGKINAIVKQFRNNSKTGIVGAKDFMRNEYDEEKKVLETSNSEKMKELISKYNLTVTNYTFVVGMMFWIRTEIIRKFFSAHSALACRELLEEGDSTDQYEGTYTHSWERIFCLLANDQHYTIKGI
ncbi:MAG: rhamnan synthesis F family protein [Chitinophagaceae bacterium]